MHQGSGVGGTSQGGDRSRALGQGDGETEHKETSMNYAKREEA